MRTSVFIFLSVVLLLLGCKEDFFDSVVDVKVPVHQPQPTVFANFNEEASAAYITFVSHSLGILDSNSIEPLNDARIILYEEAEPYILFDLEYRDGRPLFYEGRKRNFKPNTPYTLKIDSPEYGSLEGTQIVPSKVDIINATYNERKAVDRYGDRGEEVTITFRDPAGEKNFYEVFVLADFKLSGIDSIIGENVLINDSPIDPIIQEAQGKQIFSDVSFDGKEYTMKFVVFIEDERVFTEREELAKLKIYLLSNTQDYHSYWTSLDTYFDNKDNIFAEPTNVYENVEGGIGIFTIGTGDVFNIEF